MQLVLNYNQSGWLECIWQWLSRTSLSLNWTHEYPGLLHVAAKEYKEPPEVRLQRFCGWCPAAVVSYP